MNVKQLNSMSTADAQAALLRCCGSTAWASAVLEHRPFHSFDDLLAAATAAEAVMSRDDWLEAFAAHPRIGDVASLKEKFAVTASLCESEQAGVAAANDDVLAQLADGNREYEKRFGHIFIVCATGKAAAEMLQLLQERLSNDPAEELRIAAAEQAKITRLRLEK